MPSPNDPTAAFPPSQSTSGWTSASGTTTPSSIPSQTADPRAGELMRNKNTREAKETLILQMVVREGEKVICNMENEAGQAQAVTVIEYVYYALQEDQLQLQNTMHQHMLEEAMSHVHDHDFKSERFFLNSHDPQISNLAFELVTDKEELSKYYSQHAPATTHQDESAQLMDQVTHLLIDLKLCIVEQQKKDIMLQMRDPSVISDKGRLRDLMAQFQQIKEVENALAKACGDRVFMH